MADITFSEASFTSAYRAFTAEYGQDIHQATQKAQEVASQNDSASAMANAEVVDAVFISPVAAQLYAQQTERQKRVAATSKTKEQQGAAGSTTADKPSQEIVSPVQPKPHDR